jgi:hypothetical protein
VVVGSSTYEARYFRACRFGAPRRQRADLHFMDTEGERKGARREQEGRMNCVASEDIACDEGHGVGP